MARLLEKPHDSPHAHHKRHHLHKITVSATDKVTNVPLADIKVQLSGPTDPPAQKTGADGQVIFEHLAAGRYTAMATDIDYYFLPEKQTNRSSNHLSFVGLQKRQGLDTGGWTLNYQAARADGKSFVCRYLATDDLNRYGPGLTDQQVQELLALKKPPLPPLGAVGAPPLGIPLLAAEAARYNAAKMDLVAIWEIPEQHRYRPIACLSINAQRKAGFADGQFASTRMKEIGGAGKPIYFCVDFNVQEDDWIRTTPDINAKHRKIQLGELIMAYFEGINEAIEVDRIGVYGTYTTLDHLFHKGMVKYGWQQTFRRGTVTHPRAQLQQYDIYPPIDWDLNGFGGLDLDRAAHPDFGQWRSTRTLGSLTTAEIQAECDTIDTAYKRDALLTKLRGLSPLQFEEVLRLATIPPAYFPNVSATQDIRSVDVIRYFEQHNQLAQLELILKVVTLGSS